MKQLLVLLIIVFFCFPSFVQAGEGDYVGTCESIDSSGTGDSWDHFTCVVIGGTNWGPTGKTCDVGEPDYNQCGGSYPSNAACGFDDKNGNGVFDSGVDTVFQNCCLICDGGQDPDVPIIPHGGACGEGIIGECEAGVTSCREGMCLRSGGYYSFANGPCFHDSECGQGVGQNPHAPLICDPSTQKCDGVECDIDSDCASLGADAFCDATYTCQNGDVDPVVNDPDPDPGKGAPFDYCGQIPEGQRSQCAECIGRGKEGDYIFTAVGCIEVSGSGLAGDLIRLLLGVSGGVALLSLLAAAFKFSISQGDSGKIKEAKELITSAVTGLFFLIFSVTILQFIGVDILHIPGLQGGSSGGSSQPPDPDPVIVSAVPMTVPPGGECSFNFQCATTKDLPQYGLRYVFSQCVDGICEDWSMQEIGCLYEANPDEECRQLTGYDQSVCFEFPDGVGNCSLIEGIGDQMQPVRSVPIGESCLDNSECQNSWQSGGQTYHVDSHCVENVCTVNIVSGTDCENQPNPDQFCQQLTDSDHSYCMFGTDYSQCNIVTDIPEMLTCENDGHCNDAYRVDSGYECVFPGGGFTYPSGVTIGHCQEL